MNVYTYQADLFCEECGDALKRDLAKAKQEDTGDSDDYPQGPSPSEESDSPAHCYECGAFLENALTADGMRYAREQIEKYRERPDDAPDSIETWKDFYEIRGKLAIKLDNLDKTDGSVSVYCHDVIGAKDDQSIDGSRWEACGSDLAYAIITDRPGLVAALEAEGYEVDDSEYCEPDAEEFARLAAEVERE
jgi:hypothetical protein